jgi:hypothetical protein
MIDMAHGGQALTRSAVEDAAQRYGSFIGLPVRMSQTA